MNKVLFTTILSFILCDFVFWLWNGVFVGHAVLIATHFFTLFVLVFAFRFFSEKWPKRVLIIGFCTHLCILFFCLEDRSYLAYFFINDTPTELDSFRFGALKAIHGIIFENIGSPLMRSIYLSFFQGSWSLDFSTRALFKDLGVIHLFVISGLHINIIHRIGFFFTGLIPRSLYVVGAIQPCTFYKVDIALEIPPLLAIWAFAWLTDFSAPCVRASIMVSVSWITLRYNLDISRGNEILLCLMIQRYLFFNNFFTSSNFLSWSIYLILILFANKSFIAKVKSQILISFLLMIIFGKFPFFGIFINLFLQRFLSWFIIAVVGQFGFWIAGIDSSILLNLQAWVLQELQQTKPLLPIWSLGLTEPWRTVGCLLLVSIIGKTMYDELRQSRKGYS